MSNKKILKVFVVVEKLMIVPLDGNVATVKFSMQGNIYAVVGISKQIRKIINAVAVF